MSENIRIKEFITENRDSSDKVRSLSIKAKVYKGDQIPMIDGDGERWSYNDEVMPKKTRTGKKYEDWDNASPVLVKTFTFNLPESERTTMTYNSSTKNWKQKYIKWRKLMFAEPDYDTFYINLYSELDSMDISW